VLGKGGHVSHSIRVAVANQPRLMRELIVSTLTDQPDVEVVAEIQDEAEIQSVIQSTTPEFLIIALDVPNQRPSLCDILLQKYPHMKILALAPEGNWSVFYWASLDIHAMSLEASETEILRAMRSYSQMLGGQPSS
jgi:DNA-binding NarL/FixJ family response regulator